MKEKTKNKILLIFICVVTLIILIIALRIHKNKQENIISTSKIDKYLTEIKYEEIPPHVVEQPNVIVYVSNSSDNSSVKFEKYFSYVIRKYNLESDIIYININNVNIVDPIYQNAPELVFYKDGNISDIIDCNTLKNKKTIIEELKERGVIND